MEREVDGGMAGGPEEDLRRVRSLGDAARLFARQPSARFIAAAAIVPAALRALRGRPTLAEVGLLAGMPLLWGLQEWAAHRYLLHMKPRTVFGRRIDFEFARVHRAHHRAPWRMREVFLPMRVVRGAAPVAAGIWLAVFRDRRAALTAMSTYAAMALAYEWTHFVTHTGYAPKSRYAAHVVRSHRLHHFKHERFWLGFTLPLVDALLGTAPDPGKVATSPTCRDLGISDEPGAEATGDRERRGG